MSLPSTRLGLNAVEPLIVDDNHQSLEVVTAILMGFGINRSVKCGSVAEARDMLQTRTFDILIVDCEMPDEDGFSLVRHVRADPQGSNFTVPILMMSAVTPQSKVEDGRDNGANFTIAKPVSPTTLLERMLWIAQSQRMFISDPGYSGPDRRFHTVPLQDGVSERRNADLELTAKPERALSQDEIDGLFT
jgi:DNA-binding response OmpR family regulator